MLLLEASHLEKSFGDRLLFRLDHLEVHSHDRIGIVGRNGAGKTTLLHILAGEESADAGHVHQYGSHALIRQIGLQGMEHAVGKRKKEWGLQHIHTTDTYMSGGEAVRLKIAHALEQGAQLLFADEPTSHLDMEGIEQLEKTLTNVDGAILLISHDRSLLDAICTQILEVEDGVVTLYPGNYSHYVLQKDQQRARAKFEYESYRKEVKRLTQVIHDKQQQTKGMLKKPRQMSHSEARLISNKNGAERRMANVAKSAKSMETRLSKLEKKEKPRELPRVQFDANSSQEIHAKAVIQLDRVTCKVGDRTLFQNLSCSIKPGMKLALVGKNGAGKSSLLNMIVRGTEGITVAQSCKIGYFTQTLALLDEEKTIVENVLVTSPQSETVVRTALARLLFRRDEVQKKVEMLSGGEKGKAALAKVFLSDANVLLLDEPTNYLDIPTQEELEQLLAEYPGTIVFATHDRSFINRVATHVLVFEGAVPVFFEGNYQQYVEWKERRKQTNVPVEEELLLLQTRLSEILGRLSIPIKDPAVKQELEEQFRELTNRIRELKSKLSSF
ncbi:MAG: ribosomal protection-like ABC-F family protein [Clostridia bacterium]